MKRKPDLNTCKGGPLDKTKKKEYKQMMKAYKKLLKKDARKAHPFDSSYGLSMFIDFLSWMQSYYELGYNVWAMDITDPKLDACYTEKTRADSLKEALYLYNRWQDCCEDYYKIAETEEEIQHYLDLGFHLVPKKDDEIEKSLGKMGYRTLTLYEDMHKNVEECNKATKDYKKKFFDYLHDHIEEWWD